MAADCPTLLSNGAYVLCTPTETGVDVVFNDPINSISGTYSIIPSLITCPDLVGDVVLLGWQVVAVLVTAWSFKVLFTTLRQ